jgi:hypothetical protein
VGVRALSSNATRIGFCADKRHYVKSDLVTVTATDVRRRKTASGAAPTPPPNVVELNKSARVKGPR